MSLKLEIETWVAALTCYENNEYDDSLAEFDKIGDTSKILFNMGVIHATLGEHEKAVECYQRAIRLDKYLAVAYFQQGVSNFLLGDFEEALANFNDTLLYLRGNTMIDYAQLGLLFKLYSCEVLFNRGLCYIYLQQKDPGMQDLAYAVKEKVVEDHNVIDDAIRDEADGYTVFSIPVGVLYRPNEAKVRNLKTKDYLGKAKLVAASDRSNAFTGFAGSKIKQAAKIEPKDDRSPDNISFGASNLVKPNIQSRQTLQSEPPNGTRNVLPPTPPPDNDRSSSRSASTRNGVRPMLARLNIQSPQDSNRKYEKTSPDDIRINMSRSNSVPQDSDNGRFNMPRSNSVSNAVPSRGFPQTSFQRRPTQTIEEDASPSDVLDMYTSRDSGDFRGSGESRRRQPRYDDDDDSDYDDGSLNGAEFEMVSDYRRRPSNMSVASSNRRRPSAASNMSRNTYRRPSVQTVQNFRVKVHAEDVRCIMIGSAVEFPDFVDRIRDKFGMRYRFKIKMQDEDTPDDEMITIADQDDLEIAIMNAKEIAVRQRQEIGRMEVWIIPI